MVVGLCTVHEVDILIESLHQYDINEKKIEMFLFMLLEFS